MRLQCADVIILVKQGYQSSISQQVVDATIANNLGRVVRGLLQGGMLGEVCVENVDIGTVA